MCPNLRVVCSILFTFVRYNYFVIQTLIILTLQPFSGNSCQPLGSLTFVFHFIPTSHYYIWVLVQLFHHTVFFIPPCLPASPSYVSCIISVVLPSVLVFSQTEILKLMYPYLPSRKLCWSNEIHPLPHLKLQCIIHSSVSVIQKK